MKKQQNFIVCETKDDNKASDHLIHIYMELFYENIWLIFAKKPLCTSGAIV